jgi:hypothetical protein
VSGKRERKLTKTPADSIIEFRNTFTGLFAKAFQTNPKLRFALVIDNLDRVPRDQAKDFWSTMQTFFGDERGNSKHPTSEYWLIVPFSYEALSFIFESGSPEVGKAAQSKAKGFIEKTFSFAVYVPPPILANWRKYLLERLREAFPETSLEELHSVREIYDIAKRRGLLEVTPRNLKLFVNSLVVSYRQRGAEIALPVIASFLLHRDEIVSAATVGPELLAPEERKLINASNWRALMGALYYGVPANEANQIILQEPIIGSLQRYDPVALKSLENEPGFSDVLVSVVREEMATALDALTVARMAGTIDQLDAATAPALSSIWRLLRQEIRQANEWSNFQFAAAAGIDAIFRHTPKTERKALFDEVARKFSSATIAEPPGDGQTPFEPIGNALAVAISLVKGPEDKTDVRIELPGSARAQIEFLQQLAECNESIATKAVIRPSHSPDEIGAALSMAIAEGISLRAPASLIGFLRTYQLTLPWSASYKVVRTRLRADDLREQEIESLVSMLVAGQTIDQSDSLSFLRKLSVEGTLTHVLAKFRKKIDVKAAVIGSTLLSNPEFERSGQTGDSETGDNLYSEFQNSPVADEQLVRHIAKFVSQNQAGLLLFERAVSFPKLETIITPILSEMLKATYAFNIPAEEFVKQTEFFKKHANLLSINASLPSLVNEQKVFSLLANRPFETAGLWLYNSTLSLAVRSGNESYLNFLVSALVDLPVADWTSALEGASSHSGLLELAKGLRAHDSSFKLSTRAKDALLEISRRSARGALSVTDELRSRFRVLFDLLDDGLQKTLMSDVLDDMLATIDLGANQRTIDFLGDYIDALSLAEADPDRILRRIFSPILSSPQQQSVDWMARVVTNNPQMFSHIESQTREEISARLSSVLRTPSLPDETLQAVLKIASSLGVDVIRLESDEAPPEK